METPTETEGQSTKPRNHLNAKELAEQVGIEDVSSPQWFVMRDLKRPNAKIPAYRHLTDCGFEVFTPMHTRIIARAGRQTRIEVPYIADLLFVHSTRQALDPIVDRTPTLQYRYFRGGAYRQPLTVRPAEMDAFIAAVRQMGQPHYVSPSEITPDMYGHRVRILAPGPMNGYEGHLLRVRGSRKKRILIELPGILGLILEISSPTYLQLL